MNVPVNVADCEIAFAYDAGDTARRNEIIRNVRTILRTPAGTCPLYRDFGINTSVAIDRPMDVAKNFLAVEIMEAVERYEPRVRVSSVDFDTMQDGSLKAKVVIADGE